MESKETLLKAYKEKIEVLSLTMEVPVEKYSDVLLKLFNNKRDNKEILKLGNYYGSNDITIHINISQYIESNHTSKQEAIEHLKEWFIGSLDISLNDVEEYIYEGYIFYVDEWNNKQVIKSFDGDKLIENYIILEEY